MISKYFDILDALDELSQKRKSKLSRRTKKLSGKWYEVTLPVERSQVWRNEMLIDIQMSLCEWIEYRWLNMENLSIQSYENQQQNLKWNTAKDDDEKLLRIRTKFFLGLFFSDIIKGKTPVQN